MKMKRAAALALAMVMTLSLAACGGGAGAGDQQPGQTQGAGGQTGSGTESGGEKIVINFFHRWPNDPKNAMFKELIDQYMAENPNVTINMDCILNDQYKEKIRMVVSTDEIPDIFSSWSGTFAQEMIASGNVASLNDLYE